MAQIVCKDLTLGYEGKKVANGISFTVNKGDCLCIIGDNGSGKTTLMKALLGLHAPIGGEIETDRESAKRGIGYLPQQTDMQKDFPASVKEIVLSGIRRRFPFYCKSERERAADAMEKLGISDISGKCYRSLSGGQKQRVLLARALCATDGILLLDEPVSALDRNMTEQTYSIIESLVSEGITVIMVSHDITGALRCASHVLHLGDSVFFGTVSQYVKECGR